MAGRRPRKIDVKQSLDQLRINQNITAQMFPSLTFEPTIGVTAARIDKLGMDIRSFREPLKRSVKQVFAPSFRKNFESGGRPAWEPFAEDTTNEIQPRLHGGSHPLLIKSGLMMRTMQQLSIWSITKTSAILNNVPEKIWYARLHQAGYGGKGAKKKTSGRVLRKKGASGRQLFNFKGEDTGSRRTAPIPARPFVLLQEEDAKAVQTVFAKWMDERIARTWDT